VKRLSARRLALAIAVWVVALGSMILAGMGPNPILLAVTVAAVACGSWVVADIGSSVERANWYVLDASSTLTRGEDGRVGLLHRHLDSLASHSVDRVSPLLVGVIEDRVRNRYAVERDGDPEGFRRIVGPELAAFIQSTEADNRAIPPRSLPGIITRIEAL